MFYKILIIVLKNSGKNNSDFYRNHMTTIAKADNATSLIFPF